MNQPNDPPAVLPEEGTTPPTYPFSRARGIIGSPPEVPTTTLTNPVTCGSCGHMHATVEEGGAFHVFHRCRTRGCACNEFTPTAPPPERAP